MEKRFVSIWFRHLLTDWLVRRQPELKEIPFVLAANERGRLIVTAANEVAERSGIYKGMVLADARAIEPSVENFEDKPDLAEKLLDVLGEWCVRYTPSVSICAPDGLLLDITGCAHLRGGERPYLKDLIIKLRAFGYDARAAMADTPGLAWAVSRYGLERPIVPVGKGREVLSKLPPSALRLDDYTTERLKKVGIYKISELLKLPKPTLNRRFGQELCLRLDQALGIIEEKPLYKKHVDPYVQDLATPECVVTAEGIAKALELLLEKMCSRLNDDSRGVRYLTFDGFRIDGKVETIEIGTSRPTRSAKHLFKLFFDKLATIEPALGIEQFRLSATQVEDMSPSQDEMLSVSTGFDDISVKEMIDRLAVRYDHRQIKRYLPQERHWPERSLKATSSTTEVTTQKWTDNLRPIRILSRPEPIEVTAPVPDYPPMMFRYKGNLHRVRKADGPERIEREWWIEKGEPRDYFRLEDDAGQRYWVFRSGHYQDGVPSAWFLQGFFA